MTLTALQRLDRLERQVAALQAGAGAGESLQPNYLTVAADGSVGASFTGRVHAEGLDLDANTDPANFPDVDSIRWIHTTDGFVVARDIGGISGGAAYNNKFSYGAGQDAQVNLIARSQESPTYQAGLFLDSNAAAGAGSRATIRATAVATGSPAVTVLDDQGASNFLQLAAGTKLLRLTLGSVDSTAGAINWQSGAFTVTKNATGDFTISNLPSGTIPEPLPLLTDAAAGATPVEFVIVAKTASSFRFQSKSTAGVNTDVPFYFAAIS